MEEDLESPEAAIKSRIRNDITQPGLTHVVTICPTANCKECTGRISNELLGHTFLCMCPCHLVKEKEAINCEGNT